MISNRPSQLTLLVERRVTRSVLFAVFAWTVLTTGGCSPVQRAHRTLHRELSQFPPTTDGRSARQQSQSWAKKEWQKIISEDSADPYTSDFASGFIQGFVDHVESLGDTQRPPIPPRRYWKIGYRNERGRAAIKDYYSGFDRGARVAEENGYRQRATVPSTLFARETDEPPLSDGHVLATPNADRAMEKEVDESDPSNSAVATVSETLIDDIDVPPSLLESDVSVEDFASSGTSVGQIHQDLTDRPTEQKSRGQKSPNDLSVPRPPHHGQVDATRAAANLQLATSTILPMETASEGPPLPPWKGGIDEDTDGHGVVTVSHEEDLGQAFDPFAGSHFASLAAPSSVPDWNESRPVGLEDESASSRRAGFTRLMGVPSTLREDFVRSQPEPSFAIDLKRLDRNARLVSRKSGPPSNDDRAPHSGDGWHAVDASPPTKWKGKD